MSAAAALDLRYPIGGLFVVLGAILSVLGAVTRDDAAMYVPSGGVNINLWWGLVMLVVGVIFLALARRGARRTGVTTAGAATEAREKALGLEK